MNIWKTKGHAQPGPRPNVNQCNHNLPEHIEPKSFIIAYFILSRFQLSVFRKKAIVLLDISFSGWHRAGDRVSCQLFMACDKLKGLSQLQIPDPEE